MEFISCHDQWDIWWAPPVVIQGPGLFLSLSPPALAPLRPLFSARKRGTEVRQVLSLLAHHLLSQALGGIRYSSNPMGNCGLGRTCLHPPHSQVGLDMARDRSLVGTTVCPLGSGGGRRAQKQGGAGTAKTGSWKLLKSLHMVVLSHAWKTVTSHMTPGAPGEEHKADPEPDRRQGRQCAWCPKGEGQPPEFVGREVG